MTKTNPSQPATAQACFAAGCFWGTEAYFKQLPGVLDTEVGYTGGHTENPTYEQVLHDDTNHAEALLITFDPSRLSYADLLRHFWRMHDPTSLNRQGNDVGAQYRSAIFYTTDGQKKEAEEQKKQLQKNPGGYCHVNLSLAKKPL